MHDGRYANQNLGNRLGARPSVRLSETYRLRESGNAIKELMGSTDLMWGPQHYNRKPGNSKASDDLYLTIQTGGIARVGHRGRARDQRPDHQGAGLPRATRTGVVTDEGIKQPDDQEIEDEQPLRSSNAPRFSLDGYMRSPAAALSSALTPPSGSTAAGLSTLPQPWEQKMRRKAGQAYAVPPYATEQVIVSPEATAAVLNARDAAAKQARDTDIFGMPKRVGNSKIQGAKDPYAGNGVAACLGLF